MAERNSTGRVARGGFWYRPQVKYSKETQELLSVLMKEAKLTILQRQKLNEKVKRGESLPVTLRCNKPTATVSHVQIPKICLSGRKTGIRTRDTIEKLGYYEREQYRPVFSAPINSIQRKEQLQNIMAYGQKSMRINPFPSNSKEFQGPTKKEEIQQAAIENYASAIDAKLFKKLQQMETLEQEISKTKAKIDSF